MIAIVFLCEDEHDPGEVHALEVGVSSGSHLLCGTEPLGITLILLGFIPEKKVTKKLHEIFGPSDTGVTLEQAKASLKEFLELPKAT